MRRVEKIWNEMLPWAWIQGLSCGFLSLFLQALILLSLPTLVLPCDSSDLKMCPSGLLISVVYLVLQPSRRSHRLLFALATYLTTDRPYESPFVALRD